MASQSKQKLGEVILKEPYDDKKFAEMNNRFLH